MRVGEAKIISQRKVTVSERTSASECALCESYFIVYSLHGEHDELNFALSTRDEVFIYLTFMFKTFACCTCIRFE